MIDLITGLPGNCKTLYTIAWVRDWAKKDNRQVFYSGVPLSDEGKEKLGWLPIEPEKWFEAPPNSIVVIDEAQRIFRNRSLGQIPPKHVTELETHRHMGIDLVFITQHPSLIDPAIRKLTGRHRHMVRIWGMEASTVHEWNGVRDQCDKPAARKDSEKQKWKFDKSVYPLYKSAEVHTVKRTVPMRAKLLLLVPVLLAMCGYGVYWILFGKNQAAKPAQVQTAPPLPGQVGGAAVPLPPPAPRFDPQQDAREYMWKQTPRVTGLISTAPKYDALTQPTSVPVAAACVVMPSRNHCQCYTQQATKLDVAFNQCVEIARNGYFQEFDPDGKRRGDEPSKAAVAKLDSIERLPISNASTKDTGSNSPVTGLIPYLNAPPGVRVPPA